MMTRWIFSSFAAVRPVAASAASCDIPLSSRMVNCFSRSSMTPRFFVSSTRDRDVGFTCAGQGVVVVRSFPSSVHSCWCLHWGQVTASGIWRSAVQVRETCPISLQRRQLVVEVSLLRCWAVFRCFPLLLLLEVNGLGYGAVSSRCFIRSVWSWDRTVWVRVMAGLALGTDREDMLQNTRWPVAVVCSLYMVRGCCRAHEPGSHVACEVVSSSSRACYQEGLRFFRQYWSDHGWVDTTKYDHVTVTIRNMS